MSVENFFHTPIRGPEDYEQVAAAFGATQDVCRARLTELLQVLPTVKFKELEERQNAVGIVNHFVRLSGSELLCPKCNEPGRLRCRVIGGQPYGAFQFEHVKPKRTVHGGGSQFPKNVSVKESQ